MSEEIPGANIALAIKRRQQGYIERPHDEGTRALTFIAIVFAVGLLIGLLIGPAFGCASRLEYSPAPATSDDAGCSEVCQLTCSGGAGEPPSPGWACEATSDRDAAWCFVSATDWRCP